MFTAGWNQPGYLPETDPVDFDDFDEAKDYVISEIDRTADNAHLVNDRSALDECNDAIDDADDWTDNNNYWQVYCDGYVYWITRSD